MSRRISCKHPYNELIGFAASSPVDRPPSTLVMWPPGSTPGSNQSRKRTGHRPLYLSPVPYSLLPVARSPFPVPDSLSPVVVPYSLLPVAYSLFCQVSTTYPK